MTSYFWSGFPSLSGRPRVMYGRRHIGGATHPLCHPYRLSDSYTIVFPIVQTLSNLYPVAKPYDLPPPIRPIAPPISIRTFFSFID